MVVKEFLNPDNGHMAEKTICTKLGRRIRALRDKHNLTQEEFSAKANISTKYLQNLEGKRPKAASIVTIEKIAKAFGMNISQFFRF